MSESLISELANQIVQKQILIQWPIYLLMASISLVVGFGAAYVGAYAKKKGEFLATRADFQELLAQLKATTTVAEEVRTSISHSDWVSREWKVLRRLKLEELLQAVHEIQDWQESERNRHIFGKVKEEYPSPLPKIERICGLYFPELKDHVRSLTLMAREISVEILGTGKTMLSTWNDNEAQSKVLTGFSDKLMPMYKKQLAIIALIEDHAHDLMSDLINA